MTVFREISFKALDDLLSPVMGFPSGHGWHEPNKKQHDVFLEVPVAISIDFVHPSPKAAMETPTRTHSRLLDR